MLVDKYIVGKELEVDAVCDGEDVFVPGIMEHGGAHGRALRRLHQRLSHLLGERAGARRPSSTTPRSLGLGIGIVGLYNIQFIVDRQENVYVIEVNPRSSRTVPFLSKATGCAAGRHRHAA